MNFSYYYDIVSLNVDMFCCSETVFSEKRGPKISSHQVLFEFYIEQTAWRFNGLTRITDGLAIVKSGIPGKGSGKQKSNARRGNCGKGPTKPEKKNNKNICYDNSHMRFNLVS